jgi:hypothetical protein
LHSLYHILLIILGVNIVIKEGKRWDAQKKRRKIEIKVYWKERNV